jgi:hypothetical protein
MSSKAWDKLLLIVVGLVVIGLSAVFANLALGFGDRFGLGAASAKNDLPETSEEIAKIAKSFVEKEQLWTTPSKGEAAKPVPLFVSIPIVEAGGILIDMLDPNAPSLRPPVTNTWLLSNNLDFLNSGVLSMDPDGDGFTTLAEWEAKTDPGDPKSRPPYAEKLIFASRQQQDYILRFSARPDAEKFQIVRVPSPKWPKGDNFYLRVGEVSKDEQFRVDGFEEKKKPNNFGIEVDASEVKITYLPKNETHTLVLKADTVIPTFFAEIKFELDPQFQEYVKEGDTFNLVIDPETKYRVTKVNENSAVISYQTGTEPEQTVEITKK